MKNVTISLDEEVAKWARVEAAKAGKSLSRWIGDRLAEEMEHVARREDQVAALKKFLSGPGWPGVAKDLPKRDELYDRPALRRHEHTDLRDGPKRARKAR